MKHFNKVFVPGNISCLFVICPNDNPAFAGSLGVGFTVNKGVEVEVQFSKKTEVLFNGEKINFPTVEAVVGKLSEIIPSPIPLSGITPPMEGRELKSPSYGGGRGWVKTQEVQVKVKISSPLPLGSGFGLSGASALATAYALNDMFGLKKTTLELAKIAHVAEVENGTGMGDVVNEYYGGFLLKTVSSSQFSVHKISITGIPVYCKYFSKLSTKEILSDKKRFDSINRAGKRALAKVQELIESNGVRGPISKNQELRIMNYGEEISPFRQAQGRNDTEKRKLFAQIIQISKAFAEESGLLTDENVIQTIHEIESRSGHASMIMLGNAVFSDIPFEGATKLLIT